MEHPCPFFKPRVRTRADKKPCAIAEAVAKLTRAFEFVRIQSLHEPQLNDGLNTAESAIHLTDLAYQMSSMERIKTLMKNPVFTLRDLRLFFRCKIDMCLYPNTLPASVNAKDSGLHSREHRCSFIYTISTGNAKFI